MSLWGALLAFFWVLMGAVVFASTPAMDSRVLGTVIAFGGLLFTVQALLAGVWRVRGGVFAWDPLLGKRFGPGTIVETRREFHSVLPLEFDYLYLIDPDGEEMCMDTLARLAFLEDRRPLQARREATIRSWLDG